MNTCDCPFDSFFDGSQCQLTAEAVCTESGPNKVWDAIDSFTGVCSCGVGSCECTAGERVLSPNLKFRSLC